MSNQFDNGNVSMPQNGSKGLAIAAMVLGIIGVIFSCVYYIGIPLGIVAIVLASMSLKKKCPGRGMAITGLVLGIITLSFVLILLITAGAILALMPWSELSM